MSQFTGSHQSENKNGDDVGWMKERKLNGIMDQQSPILELEKASRPGGPSPPPTEAKMREDAACAPPTERGLLLHPRVWALGCPIA